MQRATQIAFIIIFALFMAPFVFAQKLQLEWSFLHNYGTGEPIAALPDGKRLLSASYVMEIPSGKPIVSRISSGSMRPDTFALTRNGMAVRIQDQRLLVMETGGFNALKAIDMPNPYSWSEISVDVGNWGRTAAVALRGLLYLVDLQGGGYDQVGEYDGARRFVRCGYYSPYAVMFTRESGAIKLFDARSSRDIGQIAGPFELVFDARFTSDGNSLYVLGYIGGRCSVWQYAMPSGLLTRHYPLPDVANQLQISYDDSTLSCAYVRNTGEWPRGIPVFTIDLMSQRAIVLQPSPHADSGAMALTVDGQTLYRGVRMRSGMQWDYDRRLERWNCRTGAYLGIVNSSPRYASQALLVGNGDRALVDEAFVETSPPYANRLVSKLYDSAGRELRSLNLYSGSFPHSLNVFGLSPNGLWRSVRLADGRYGLVNTATFDFVPAAVGNFECPSNTGTMAWLSIGGNLFAVDARTGNPIWQVPNEHRTQRLCPISWSADDRLAAYAQRFLQPGDIGVLPFVKSEVYLMNARTGEELRRFEIVGNGVRRVYFSPAGRLMALVTVVTDGDIYNCRIWMLDYQTGSVLWTRPYPEHFSTPISFAGDGSSVLIPGYARETFETKYYVDKVGATTGQLLSRSYLADLPTEQARIAPRLPSNPNLLVAHSGYIGAARAP